MLAAGIDLAELHRLAADKGISGDGSAEEMVEGLLDRGFGFDFIRECFGLSLDG